MQRLTIILTIFLISGATLLKANKDTLIATNNKDVFILSTLIQEYLKRTNARVLNVDELAQNDSLKRISNSFEKVELKPRGGYISVYYKFSSSRDKSKINLTTKEKERIKRLRWKIKQMNENFDGEIQFEYGERFFLIKKIVVRKE